MEIYSLGLTPKKKEKKEHFITREEIVADFSSRLGSSLFGSGDSNVQRAPEKLLHEKELDVSDDVAKKETEILDHPNGSNVIDPNEKLEEKEKLHEQGEGMQEKVQQEYGEEKADGLYHSPNFKESSFGVFNEKEEIDPKVETKTDNDPIVETEDKINTHKSEDQHGLSEIEKQLFEKIIKSIRGGTEAEFRESIDAIGEYRSKDENNCDENAPLNVAIRKELLKSVSAQLAYKGGKDVLNIFQLLDLLGINMESSDFSLIPDEVLKSEEMRTVTIKYLLWCAKELSDVPSVIEQKISSFVHGGVLTFDDVLHNDSFHLQIEKNILMFAKENARYPLEVERKIYQYSLSGLIDNRAFKKNEKLKDVSNRFLIEFLEKHQDVPDQIDKKLREYEHAGFVTRGELRGNEKMQKAIEKYLQRYKKTNKGHERKITMRINDYLHMGLIDRDTKERLLKDSD